MKLTASNVTRLFIKCLYQQGEDAVKHIRTEGLVRTVGFHSDRIAANAGNITAMLGDLPEPFYSDKGGGWSFLNLCLNKAQQPWTDMHEVAEQLLLLGLAVGKVRYCAPREWWSVLPGGVPFITIEL